MNPVEEQQGAAVISLTSGCVPSNEPDGAMIKPGENYDEANFTYTCVSESKWVMSFQITGKPGNYFTVTFPID